MPFQGFIKYVWHCLSKVLQIPIRKKLSSAKNSENFKAGDKLPSLRTLSSRSAPVVLGKEITTGTVMTLQLSGLKYGLEAPAREGKCSLTCYRGGRGGGVFSTGESDLNLLFCLPEAIPLFKVGIATSSILHHSQPPLTGGADPGSWCQAQC